MRWSIKCQDQKIVPKEERSYWTMLTSNEEKSVVHFVNNKNRCMQSTSKKELESWSLMFFISATTLTKSWKVAESSWNCQWMQELYWRKEGKYSYCIFAHGLKQILWSKLVHKNLWTKTATYNFQLIFSITVEFKFVA